MNRKTKDFSILLSFLTLFAILNITKGNAESNYTEGALQLFWLTTIGSIFVGILVFVLLFYFVYKYRENKEFTRKKVANESKFEMLWISFAILLSIILIVASTPILLNIQEPSDTAGAVEIKVKAQRFSWSVEIPENNVSLKTLASIDGQTLNLTVNQLYMLNLTASENDVIHSFFSYDLSFKIDAVPGHFNIRYFKITDPGTYIVTCAEFCGVNHYTMQFKIVATL